MHKIYMQNTSLMRLLFLGTSGAQPTKSRGLSCTCIERNGEIIMFDAGECAQSSYVRAGLGWNKKMTILITHLHGDHCIGVLGLLQTMSMQNRTEPLEIFGPPGIEEFVTANIKMLGFVPPFLTSISTVSQGTVISNSEYEIRACKASHTITSFSYILHEKSRPGRFSTENAKRLNIPKGPLWGILQSGDEVVVEGNIIKPEQVLGEARPGKRIGISGDTTPSADLERFFAKCDYLIFDATFLDEQRRRAAETRHSTAAQAAALAKAAGVKKLILTHFSARYKDDGQHVAEAQKIHPAVIAASDMLEIQIEK